MADRFGASSLTAILAVAGLVGLSVVGFRAMNGSPAEAELVANGDVCLLLGEESSATKARSCCPSDAKSEANGDCADAAKECGEKSCGDKAESCHHNGDRAESCGEKAECGEKASCSDKAECDHNGDAAKATECKELKDGCNGDGTNGCCGGCAEKVECEGKAECSDKTEAPRTCCRQNQ